MKTLNLYAGVGGNRKLWENIDVTAVEKSEVIASVYERLHPHDEVIVGDAREYLVKNYFRFEFIWSSPPCQTHTQLNKFSRHRPKALPDLGLYEEIIFLKSFFKGLWIVENVVPYYKSLIKPSLVIGRHAFWSNFSIPALPNIKVEGDFLKLSNLAGKKAMMDWLGIHFKENIYYEGNHCPVQVLRNCVHPLIGKHIFDKVKGIYNSK